MPVGPGQGGLLELSAGLQELFIREATGRVVHPSAALGPPPAGEAADRLGLVWVQERGETLTQRDWQGTEKR